MKTLFIDSPLNSKNINEQDSKFIHSVTKKILGVYFYDVKSIFTSSSNQEQVMMQI